MRALRHPALGLALVMVGLVPLSQQMVQVANLWLFDEGSVSLRLALPMLLTVLVSGLQVATGVAITRQRGAGVLFGAWVLAGVSLVIETAVVMRGEAPLFSPLPVLGAAVETFGMPVLIAVVSLRYPDDLEETRTFSDISAALFMIALTSFVMTPISIANTVRMTQGGSLALRDWASLLAWPAVTLALGVIAAVGTRSRPMARLYIYLDAAVFVVFSALTVGWSVFGGDHDMVRRFMIVSRVLGLVALTLPAVLWLYLGSLDGERQGSRLPMWIALTYVPTLLSRLGLSNELTAQFGHAPTMWIIATAVGFALVLLALGDASLRNLPVARVWAIAAAVIAVSLLVIGVITVSHSDPSVYRHRFDYALLAPLGFLIASTIGAAVYSRR